MGFESIGRQTNQRFVLKKGGMVRIGLCFLIACIFASQLQSFDEESGSLPTEASLLADPRLFQNWVERVLASDRKVRAKAAAELVHGGGRIPASVTTFSS